MSQTSRRRGALVVTIEEAGNVLRGLALPYGEYAIIAEADGSLFAEVFDSESIRNLPSNIPLLVGHNRAAPPAGRVLRTGHSAHGLAVEAELVGTDGELDGWRRRFAADLMTGLSIAFRAGLPEWEKPPRRGLPPVKRIRKAEIVEISLVSWPAYHGAGVTSVNLRSAGDEAAHLESEEIIAWWADRKKVAASKSRDS